ncbi:hypothetical protein FOZ60_014326 [Perkinsus olseni]|uniref:Mediator of RNA polymerase II transcription subunit 6 n=1 Tax=Perkinsus olseni TaxID=32597 RepID=A0A7J6P9H4_PEROL|nr:hypothetical protein FOZ60_014326 [Perkinsus olseni]
MSAPISSPTTPLANQAVADKLSDMSFRFPQFLMAEGLHPGNVLEYFYQSPFYLQLDGPESLNDKVRKNELRPDEVPYTEGTVYELVGMNKEAEAGNVPLSIFVIQRVKQRKAGFRTGPGGQPVPCRRAAQQMFYIIAGNAYKAPCLGRLLERQLTMAFTRVDDILNTCKETFGMSSSGLLQGDDNELTEKALGKHGGCGSVAR